MTPAAGGLTTFRLSLRVVISWALSCGDGPRIKYSDGARDHVLARDVLCASVMANVSAFGLGRHTSGLFLRAPLGGQTQSRWFSPNKLGSDLTVDPPDHLVSLLDNIVAREDQDKFIGNVEPHDINSHTIVRNIQDEALARRSVGADLYLHYMKEVAA
jgi:hypothetical protein